MSEAIAQAPAVKAKSAPAAKPKGRKAKRTRAQRWLYALEVFARAVAAILGGYITASLGTAVLARVLPGPVAEATIAATAFAFVIYVSIAIWAFADAKAWRVWVGLIGLCAVLSGALWWSLSLEPRL